MTRRYYHMAPDMYRESIERDGLVPGRYDSGGVWLWTEKPQASPNCDIWEVLPNGLSVEPGYLASAEWGEDDPVAVTYDVIPASSVRSSSALFANGRTKPASVQVRTWTFGMNQPPRAS